MVILSVYFNKSAMDDVEKQLITYFIADNHKATGRVVHFDSYELTNKKRGNAVNHYRGREELPSRVILPLWENHLYPCGLVKTPTLTELRTRELFKYSPIKALTADREKLIDEIISSSDNNYIINGDAGTGKTVLLTNLAAKIFSSLPDVTIAIVVQPNWEKTCAEIFRVFGMDSHRISVRTSTRLIKEREKYDFIIVDEAHKLSRRYGKQHPTFNSVYNIRGFRSCDSHLEIIQKLGSRIVLMYDVLQAIRPSNITREMFRQLTTGYTEKFLSTQYRIQTPPGKSYTSEDYINGIKYLLYKDTGLLKPESLSFNPELFRDNSPDAYFGYFTDQPLHRLTEWIEEDRNFHPENINRILAGLVEKWKPSDGKHPHITHWHEDGMARRWNSSQTNWLNSKDKDAEDQIGSVFAIQGMDLNKAGVLIGNDLQLDSNGRLYAEPKNFFNRNGIFTNEELNSESNRFEFTLFVLNIYYVLLTRGIDGVRLGFWKNDEFRQYMEKTLGIC